MAAESISKTELKEVVEALKRGVLPRQHQLNQLIKLIEEQELTIQRLQQPQVGTGQNDVGEQPQSKQMQLIEEENARSLANKQHRGDDRTVVGHSEEKKQK